jgi:hypothetical protein
VQRKRQPAAHLPANPALLRPSTCGGAGHGPSPVSYTIASASTATFDELVAARPGGGDHNRLEHAEVADQLPELRASCGVGEAVDHLDWQALAAQLWRRFGM